MTTRRDFLQLGTGSLLATAVPPTFLPARQSAPAALLEILRDPDRVLVRTTAGDQTLQRIRPGAGWEGGGVTARFVTVPGALRATLTAPGIGVARLGMRWNGALGRTRLLLGDAWERGYGDFEWRGFVPDRVMPWYTMLWDGTQADGYGVRTGTAAFCFWQADPDGLTLWADVRSGGTPVQLGDRTLDVCDVVQRGGTAGESPFTALRAFCHQMCPAPRLPAAPVYGHNDWYWAYGNNSADSARADTARIVELSPTGANRPFVVIDDGWQPGRGASKSGAGTWDHGNERFPDMPGLAADVRRAGARLGAWIRPLEAAADVSDSMRLPRDRSTLDPTVAGVQEKVHADFARLRSWGIELIKHDYSTWDIFGRWGNQMGSALTRDGWTFAEGPRRTTAEVINALYATIRSGAGDALVIGCNTVSHLSAGVFELCRIGDDTSGREWARTRRMGVNALAFRGAQHGAFYAADADCVGVTTAIPWELNRQWLTLVAQSGTPLFVSIAADALGAPQQRDVRTALAFASRPLPLGQPDNWLRDTWPSIWTLNGVEHRFDWGSADG
jgi:alpha-galactosidase